MLWIFLILSLPFLMWVWLGITFTILIYVAETIKEAIMQAEATQASNELARIIRYTALDEPSMPNLLSFFEEGRNILHIDRAQADRLPEFMRNRLEMTEEIFTRVYDHGATLTFAPYNRD